MLRTTRLTAGLFLLLLALWSSNCSLYDQTIKTERAVEVAAARLSVAATNFEGEVHEANAKHQARADETHKLLMQIGGAVLLGLGWFTKRNVWTMFKCNKREKEKETV